MKAKEMPEKIYLLDYNDAMVTPLEGDTTYVREDAFIEKAQLFLIDKLKEIPMGNGKMKIKADCSLEDFIEEFKEAMKV